MPSERSNAYTCGSSGEQHREVPVGDDGILVAELDEPSVVVEDRVRVVVRLRATLISPWLGLTADPRRPGGEAGVGATRPTASGCVRCRGCCGAARHHATRRPRPAAVASAKWLSVSMSRKSSIDGERRRWSSRSPRPGRRTACRGGGAASVASILAASTRWAPSSPKRDTDRGWSWLFEYRLFQPTSCSPRCHRPSDALSRRRSNGCGVPLRAPVIDGDVLELEHHVELVAAGSVNSRAWSTVTPGISPTVSSSTSRPANTSRCISCRNSWLRGPQTGSAAARRRTAHPRAPAPSGQRRVLGDHVDHVHAEPVDATVEPPPHHLVHRRADLRVLPVEVGLLAGEQVEVVLAGRRGRGATPAPRRTIPSWSARRPGSPASSPARGGRHQYQSRFGAVAARARFDEPRVLVGGVVDDEVHHQLHAARVDVGEQLVEVRQGAEDRVDVPVVGDVVAVVVLRAALDRRQPDHVDAEQREVVEPLE